MNKSTLSTKERFLSHVSIPENLDGCWEWKGVKNNGGYGVFRLNHKNCYAHRIGFELFVGPIPNKLCVCHLCDNRACVNPHHLFLGTYKDNIDDKVKKDRQAKGEEIKSSKLIKRDIYKIREISKRGYTQQEIAKMFGVQKTTISRILSNKNWSWLK